MSEATAFLLSDEPHHQVGERLVSARRVLAGIKALAMLAKEQRCAKPTDDIAAQRAFAPGLSVLQPALLLGGNSHVNALHACRVAIAMSSHGRRYKSTQRAQQRAGRPIAP